MATTAMNNLYMILENLCSQSDQNFLDNGPDIVKEYFSKGDLLLGNEFEEPSGSYSRAILIGDVGQFVVRAMSWPNDFYLPPHEHHDRPCIELLVSGFMSVDDIEATKVGDDLYKLRVSKRNILKPGDIAIVDPSITQIHEITTFQQSTSLHFYPSDEKISHRYMQQDKGLFLREEFKLGQ